MDIELSSDNLWDDSDRAQVLMRRRSHLSSAIVSFEGYRNEFGDWVDFIDLAESESDDEALGEALVGLENLRSIVFKLRLESLLSGEADSHDSYLEIHAGAGGTESQDWVDMLARMYSRWGESRSYSVSIIQQAFGEEAGSKSITLKISGLLAYGWLKSEQGVHRLVRISPFDSNSRRHTSFASVSVYPDLPDDIEVLVNDSDLRVDTFRASGAGGQHVNTTDSAVRVTHLPSGLVVQCQKDRSQHKNRAEALKMLRSRLYELELRRRESNLQLDYDSKSQISWSHHIRSYVMQPYRLVKDLRTGIESSSVDSVMDGDLDLFLEGALALHLGN